MGIPSSWPADAAAFQASMLYILSLFCQPSLNPASLWHHAVGTLHGGHRQHSEVVTTITAAEKAIAPLDLSAAGALWMDHGKYSSGFGYKYL